jgi:hypothetical protein
VGAVLISLGGYGFLCWLAFLSWQEAMPDDLYKAISLEAFKWFVTTLSALPLFFVLRPLARSISHFIGDCFSAGMDGVFSVAAFAATLVRTSTGAVVTWKKLLITEIRQNCRDIDPILGDADEAFYERFPNTPPTRFDVAVHDASNKLMVAGYCARSLASTLRMKMMAVIDPITRERDA